MLKTRLILIALILGLMAGGAILWASDVNTEWKILYAFVGGLFYLSGSTLLAITFFTLKDERIPKNSWAYWYFSNFYKVKEETEDGKEITVVRMPKYIKTCPALWWIVWGILTFSLVITVSSLIVYVLGYAVYYGVTVGYVMAEFVKLIVLLGVVAAVIGFIALAVYLVGFCKNIFLKTIGGLMTLSFLVGFFWGLPIYIYMYDRGMSFGKAGTLAATEAGVGLGIFLGIILGIVIASVGIVTLAVKIFPFVKNSLVGKLIVALYGNLCPMIPVELDQAEESPPSPAVVAS